MRPPRRDTWSEQERSPGSGSPPSRSRGPARTARRRRQGGAIDDFRGAQRGQIIPFLETAGRGDDAIAQAREERDGHRTHPAAGAGHEDVTPVGRHAAMLKGEHAQHRRVAGGSDRHGVTGRDRVGQLDDPVAGNPRALRIAAVVRLAQAPAVHDHAVARGEPAIGRRLHDTRKVDAQHQREGLDDVGHPAERDAVLVVHSGPLDRDGHIAGVQVGVRHRLHLGHDPVAILARDQSLERHIFLPGNVGRF